MALRRTALRSARMESPAEGFDRLRLEIEQLKGFLRETPSTDAASSLVSPHFAALLGRPMHATTIDTDDLSAKDTQLLNRALLAREEVLAALGNEIFRPRGTQVPRAMNPPSHPLFDNSIRQPVREPSPASYALGKATQWYYDASHFQEPDFTDGLVAAFHAVVRRTSLSLSQHAAGCVASSPIDPELQGMVEPKLLAQLTGAAAGEVAKLVGDDRKGFFHHEVELASMPTVSHLCVVCGTQRDTPLKAIKSAVTLGGDPASGNLLASLTSMASSSSSSSLPVTTPAAAAGGGVGGGASTSPFATSTSPPPFSPILDGGIVALLPHGNNNGQESAPPPQGLRALLNTARDAASERGAVVYAVVNFETREFLAARKGSGRRGRWVEASFSPWTSTKRQWVFESPLLQPASAARFNEEADDQAGTTATLEAAAPDWRLVDMDGVLEGNWLAWKHLLLGHEHGKQGGAAVVTASPEAPER